MNVTPLASMLAIVASRRRSLGRPTNVRRLGAWSIAEIASPARTIPVTVTWSTARADSPPIPVAAAVRQSACRGAFLAGNVGHVVKRIAAARRANFFQRQRGRAGTRLRHDRGADCSGSACRYGPLDRDLPNAADAPARHEVREESHDFMEPALQCELDPPALSRTFFRRFRGRKRRQDSSRRDRGGVENVEDVFGSFRGLGCARIRNSPFEGAYFLPQGR